jgi:16S rRNA C1402 (ribose-2'-O) methylase RsmI
MPDVTNPRRNRPAPRRAAGAGRLILLPWHVGDARDITVGVAAELARLRTILVESVEGARRELRGILRIDPAAKDLRAVPVLPDPAFLRGVVETLALQDVGLMASGGAPAFVDPGAWLVAALRARGTRVVARGGASCLATMLALSGIEWCDKRTCCFTFAFFLDGPDDTADERRFRRLARRPEPLFVFLRRTRLERCLRVLRDEVGRRPVTLFFDLTKGPSRRFPLADEVRSATCERWLALLPRLPWGRLSDVSLMVGPGPLRPVSAPRRSASRGPHRSPRGASSGGCP